LSLLLIVATPSYVSFRSFGRELLVHNAIFASEAARFLELLLRTAGLLSTPLGPAGRCPSMASVRSAR